MLSTIRAFAKSWVATGLIGLLIISFGIWGVQGKLHGKISSDVVTAGDHHLSGPQFKRIFTNDLRQLEQQQPGQQISIQEAVSAGFDLRALDDAATHEAYADYVSRLGLRPTDRMLLEEIAKVPAFASPVTGRFDRTNYETVLKNNDLTPDAFEAEARDDIAQNQLDSGVAAGLQAPKTYGAVIAAYELESRDLSYFVLAPQSVTPPPLPTDAQLQSFLNAHADALKRPETRLLTVVRFSAKALAASMPVDPAALQKLYAFRKDTASSPEKRSLVQIPVKTSAEANQVGARLRAGENPAAVAKALGVQPIVYNDAPQTVIADPRIAQAAFAMKSGEVSGPVQGSLGLDVIKITDIKPAHAATLEEMRPQLEAQVRTDAAAKKVYDMGHSYDQAHGAGGDIVASAKAAGVTPETIGPISADGAVVNGALPAGLSPKLLRDAFQLPQGGERDMVSDGPGEYFSVRVDKILPPAVPALADIKPQLTRSYMINQMQTLLKAKADGLAARIRKGERFDAVAASAGVKVGRATGVTRAALAQNRAINQDLAIQIFSVKKGDVFIGPTGQVAVMVARVDASNPPAQAQAAAMTAQRGDSVTGQLYSDVSLALRAAAKAQIKPSTDIDLARSALGLTGDSPPKDPGQKPARAPAS